MRRRRRRTATALASAAAAVAVTAGGGQLLTHRATGGQVVVPADTSTATPPSTPTSADPSPPSPTTPSARVRLAVTTAEVPATFASLGPGEVSQPSPKSGPDAAPVVDFTWNGFGIRVGLTPDDYASGRRVPDPLTRCEEEGSGGPCRLRPDGTVVRTASFLNPPVDGGTSARSVAVFRPDGWDVLVMAYNGAAKEGPPTAEQPPFDLTELERIARSDVWFR